MRHEIELLTILIVDDEPFIRRLIERTLQPLGWRLLAASSSEEALRISRATEGTIDLLLTDLTMPGMNGWELARVLKKKRPSLEVVLMSGYPGSVIANLTTPDIETIFIQKPFSPGKLMGKLQEVLGDRAG